MQAHHVIDRTELTIEHIAHILRSGLPLRLSDAARRATEGCHLFLKNKLQNENRLFYGINTGFGSLCNVHISNDEVTTLQRNLVRSHACGTGDEVPPEVVKIMLLLKIQSLSYGHSGVRVATVERLIHFFNHNALPVVYQLGSLGASGDLAPLAHLSLPLLGEGTLYHNGVKMSTAEYYDHAALTPLQLEAKEGLALLNGTQFSAAYGIWCLLQAQRLAQQANFNAALAVDAFDCRLEPFDERLHRVRPHRGQQRTAAAIRDLLRGSAIGAAPKTAVQDPYAFRCVPQVHGASLDALDHVAHVFTVEINAVTDNPTLFPEDDAILSGGNFHAQPLALTLDYLAIALAELGNIAERRVFQLMSGARGLPVYLTSRGGLHSGMMIAQYTAASIVSQNKQLCTPASVDSIVSSNGQEDHVSMASNAATKCYRVVQNLERILAIEYMVGMQALDFRRPAQSSEAIEKQYAAYRKHVPKLDEDRILHDDIEKTVAFLRENGD